MTACAPQQTLCLQILQFSINTTGSRTGSSQEELLTMRTLAWVVIPLLYTQVNTFCWKPNHNPFTGAPDTERVDSTTGKIIQTPLPLPLEISPLLQLLLTFYRLLRFTSFLLGGWKIPIPRYSIFCQEIMFENSFVLFYKKGGSGAGRHFLVT